MVTGWYPGCQWAANLYTPTFSAMLVSHTETIRQERGDRTMSITGELITTDSGLRDREAQAVKNFGYAVAYHCKTAETLAVESPEERGRNAFAAIADEYRYLARVILTSQGKDMAAFYAGKCDLIETIRQDPDRVPPGQVYGVGDEPGFRKSLGDVRYFLRYHHDYVWRECILVENLDTRRIMSESAHMIKSIENIFRRWELGDLEWFSETMETWVRACMAARDNQPIDL